MKKLCLILLIATLVPFSATFAKSNKDLNFTQDPINQLQVSLLSSKPTPPTSSLLFLATTWQKAASLRTVHLDEITQEGLVFSAYISSDISKHIAENDKVAALLLWPIDRSSFEQIKMKGVAITLPDTTETGYQHTKDSPIVSYIIKPNWMQFTRITDANGKRTYIDVTYSYKDNKWSHSNPQTTTLALQDKKPNSHANSTPQK